MKAIIFLIVILTAVFGAGIADVVYTDVVPMRPYTVFFQTYDTTSLSQVSHQIGRGPAAPVTSLGLVALLIVAVLAIFLPLLAYHVVAIIPLGARGSHSRANRRANAGWKMDTRENVREQFRILREIFGDPNMIMLYGTRDKPRKRPKQKDEEKQP